MRIASGVRVRVEVREQCAELALHGAGIERMRAARDSARTQLGGAARAGQVGDDLVELALHGASGIRSTVGPAAASAVGDGCGRVHAARSGRVLVEMGEQGGHLRAHGARGQRKRVAIHGSHVDVLGGMPPLCAAEVRLERGIDLLEHGLHLVPDGIEDAEAAREHTDGAGLGKDEALPAALVIRHEWIRAEVAVQDLALAKSPRDIHDEERVGLKRRRYGLARGRLRALPHHEPEALVEAEEHLL